MEIESWCRVHGIEDQGQVEDVYLLVRRMDEVLFAWNRDHKPDPPPKK